METRNTLNDAKRRKADEFYTLYEDIEKEMKYYTHFFKDKTVYCNCDNHDSNFRKYFFDNFDKLGLKRLICTSYPHGTLEDTNKDETQLSIMKGDGDFRSEECIEFLKQCDIVVTNPPFSLFRQHLKLIMEHGKKFITLGTNKGVVTKEVFPYFKRNEVRLGVSIHSGDREFRVPDDYPLSEKSSRIDEKGVKYIRVDGVRWYTNFDISQDNKGIEPICHYNEKDYPKYDNLDAIHVKNSKDIPVDYDGLMGVPVTYIDRQREDLFEIVGIFNRFSESDYENGFICGENAEYEEKSGKVLKTRGPVLNRKALYTRILIKRKI